MRSRGESYEVTMGEKRAGGKVMDESMEAEQRPKDGAPGIRTLMTNTTCHGVKHIAETDSHILRKILWLVCVTLAISLFLMNVITRAGNYFDYPTNVDVSVYYTESMKFPAVTVCNLNNFRITQAANQSLFKFLEDYYSGDKTQSNEAILQHMETLDKMNTSVFLHTVSHQMEDLIYRCKWSDEPCNLDNDFKVTFSDLGVCYTYFKGDTVTAPGSKNALSLVLNLEQYEYMKGPHDDAGVKVLLHDPDEKPLMDDLGFVLAPGTHTMVKIDQTQRSSLPAPYGLCHQDVRFRSNCLLQCQIQNWVDEFQCVDAYMQSTCRNCSICGMKDLYRHKLKKLAGWCECPVPCVRTIYSPKLSYAQISRNNIERLAQGSNQQTHDLKTKFHHAREVQERVVTTKADANKERINVVLQVIHATRKSVEEGRMYLESSSALATHIQTGELLSENAFLSSQEAIAEAYARQKTQLDRYKRMLNVYSAIVATVGKIYNYYEYGIGNLTASGVEEIEEFIGNCTYTDQEITDITVQSQDRVPMPEYTEPCKRYLYNIMVTAFNAPGDINMMSMLNGMSALYKPLINTFYDDWKDLPPNALCVGAVKRIMEEWATPLFGIRAKFSAMKNKKAVEENIVEVTQVLNQTLEFASRIIEGNDTDYIDYCTWVFAEWPMKVNTETYKENPNPEQNEKWLLYKSSMGTAVGSYGGLQHSFEDMQTHLTNLDSMLKSFETLLEPIRRYLTEESTKAETASVLMSTEVNQMYIKLQQTIGNVIPALDKFTQTNADISQSTQTAFKQILSLSVPILRNDVLIQLPLWQRLVVDTSNPTIVDMVNGSMFDLREQADDVLGAAIDLHAMDAQNLSQTLKSLEKEFVTSYEVLVKDAQVYRQENAMDHSFYIENLLKVDIYYEEMSFTKIQQKKAFKLLSLFGEVGGFLGLLLGASVLTICEVVDYGFMVMLAKMRSKRAN